MGTIGKKGTGLAEADAAVFASSSSLRRIRSRKNYAFQMPLLDADEIWATRHGWWPMEEGERERRGAAFDQLLSAARVGLCPLCGRSVGLALFSERKKTQQIETRNRRH